MYKNPKEGGHCPPQPTPMPASSLVVALVKGKVHIEMHFLRVVGSIIIAGAVLQLLVRNP